MKTIFLIILLTGQPVEKPLQLSTLNECVTIGERVIARHPDHTYRCEER